MNIPPRKALIDRHELTKKQILQYLLLTKKLFTHEQAYKDIKYMDMEGLIANKQ